MADVGGILYDQDATFVDIGHERVGEEEDPKLKLIQELKTMDLLHPRPHREAEGAEENEESEESEDQDEAAFSLFRGAAPLRVQDIRAAEQAQRDAALEEEGEDEEEEGAEASQDEEEEEEEGSEAEESEDDAADLR